MFMKSSYVIALSLALSTPLGTSAGYNCGTDYLDAISNCDMPCPSMLGYNAEAVVNECPEHKPYCYQALDCPDVAQGEVQAVVEETIKTNETMTNETMTNETMTNETELLDMDLAIDSIETEDEPMMLHSSEATIVEVEDEPDEYEQRRSLPNPGNHFCAIGWNEATIECETNVDAIPCPPDENGAYTSCPQGTYCYGIANCVRPDPSTNAPTLTPTTYAPTTSAPSSSPISAEDPANFYFCGSDLEDANENCGQWCRYGTDDECPGDQICHLESTCNATALNITLNWDISLETETPSAMPTTYAPTVDNNPENLYCSEAWLPNDYDGPCGLPCPG